MQVSKEEILHIANLARLDLNENEVEKYIEKFTGYVLNFVNISKQCTSRRIRYNNSK